MVKPAIMLLVVFSTLVVMWGNAAVQVTAPKDATCNTPLKRTLYAQIHDGMSYAEVREVIGSEPTERLCTTGLVNRKEFVEIYTWTDTSRRAITVCFHDGMFRHKDQAWAQ